MSVIDAFSHRLRVAQLNPHKPTAITLTPEADQRAAIAAALGITAVPALRLDAQIAPASHDAWELTGRITARVVQPCGITLSPVETAIDETVRRLYSPHTAQPQGEEVEMLDDEIEPLGQSIDAGGVMVEALALALPQYPRAPGAELEAPGPDGALDNEDTRRPFAGLADLLDRKPTRD